jgi:phosphoadenosine phosphosulfate reductase
MGQRKNLRNMRRLSRDLKRYTSQGLLSWAFATYGDRVVLTSSFGAQSATLIHLACQMNPDVRVVFLDTGFHFPETYEFVETLRKRFDLNLEVFGPTPDELEQSKERLARGKTAQCCDLAKVKSMERALDGAECWIAGVRRRQAMTRNRLKLVEEYASGIVKVHPIAYWKNRDVETYMMEHNLPHHPLWEKGYTSIGCEPCTRRPILGQGLRSGRWAGVQKTECGIHTFLSKSEGSQA